MEQLIGLILFGIVAGLGQWLQKRAAREDESSLPPIDPFPGGSRPEAQPRRPLQWEEETRKANREAERHVLKPIIIERSSPPAASNHPKLPPVIVRERGEGDLVLKSRQRKEEAVHARARALQQAVASRMEEFQDLQKYHNVHHASKGRKTGSREIRNAVRLTKSSQGMRQAFIASILIAPPKGLKVTSESGIL
ncbi:MAG: hypothetical protein ACO1QB_13785 [Verrucomicrobiales bacterium]